MRVKSTEATTFIDEAGWATKVWMQKTKWQTPDKKAKVIVNVWIFWKDNRRRDADNTFKLLLDSMKGIAFQDDSQVLPRVMDYNVDKQNPRIEIELRVMEAV
jgi:crossover junction endodeoxyribonuclease RusA